MDPRAPLAIHHTIVGIGRKSDLPAAVCRTFVAELLETSFPVLLLIYTDGSVDSQRGTATAGCHIPTLGVNLSGRLNYCATSTTAELCAIRLALQYLLHLPVPSKALILTDSRAALSSPTNKPTLTLFARELVDTRRAVEDAGWTLHLQWIPSHVGVFGNEAPDHLAKAAHHDEEPTIHIHRLVEAGHLIRRQLRLRHPDVRVATGIPPPPVPHQDMSRADAALVHRLRCDSAFTRALLHRIGRQENSNSSTCSVPEDVEHVLLR